MWNGHARGSGSSDSHARTQMHMYANCCLGAAEGEPSEDSNTSASTAAAADSAAADLGALELSGDANCTPPSQSEGSLLKKKACHSHV